VMIYNRDNIRILRQTVYGSLLVTKEYGLSRKGKQKIVFLYYYPFGLHAPSF